ALRRRSPLGAALAPGAARRALSRQEPVLRACGGGLVFGAPRRARRRPHLGADGSRAREAAARRSGVLWVLRIRKGPRGGPGAPRRGGGLAPFPRRSSLARPVLLQHQRRVGTARRRIRFAALSHDGSQPTLVSGAARGPRLRQSQGSLRLELPGGRDP